MENKNYKKKKWIIWSLRQDLIFFVHLNTFFMAISDKNNITSVMIIRKRKKKKEIFQSENNKLHGHFNKNWKTLSENLDFFYWKHPAGHDWSRCIFVDHWKVKLKTFVSILSRACARNSNLKSEMNTHQQTNVKWQTILLIANI